MSFLCAFVNYILRFFLSCMSNSSRLNWFPVHPTPGLNKPGLNKLHSSLSLSLFQNIVPSLRRWSALWHSRVSHFIGGDSRRAWQNARRFQRFRMNGRKENPSIALIWIGAELAHSKRVTASSSSSSAELSKPRHTVKNREAMWRANVILRACVYGTTWFARVTRPHCEDHIGRG